MRRRPVAPRGDAVEKDGHAMQRTRRGGWASHHGGQAVQDRLAAAARPAIEAALVAAVAIGVAQMGWAVLTPNSAGASASGLGDPARSDVTQMDAAAELTRSPFAPELAASPASTNAANALIAGIQLGGVRVGADPRESSAVLTMTDGFQRAFRVGEEIADGVHLGEVTGESVILTYSGGQKRLSLAAAPASYADALLGRGPIPQAGPLVLTAPERPAAPSAEATPFAPTPTPPQAAVESPTLALLAEPQPAAIAEAAAAIEAAGFTLPEQLPAGLAALGLQPGDVIVAINGQAASREVAIAAAAASAPVTLDVRRGEALVTLAPIPNRSSVLQ
jgi:type II secretory pathway component PulC